MGPVLLLGDPSEDSKASRDVVGVGPSRYRANRLARRAAASVADTMANVSRIGRMADLRNAAWRALLVHYGGNREFKAYLDELHGRWPNLTDIDYQTLGERFGLNAPWLKRWVADTFSSPQNEERLCALSLDIAPEDAYYLLFAAPSLPKPRRDETRKAFLKRCMETARAYADRHPFADDLRARKLLERDALWLYQRICERRRWSEIAKLAGLENYGYYASQRAVVKQAVTRLARVLYIRLPKIAAGRPRKT